ncbi:hypothetical protein GIB67_008713, partial [Kingdonia uniflora]
DFEFGWESFVGIVFGLRALIVVDVVVFLVFSVIDLKFRKLIRGAHFRWGTVWAVSPRLSFRAYHQWQVVSGFSCCCGDLWGAELEAHSPVVTFGLAA